MKQQFSVPELSTSTPTWVIMEDLARFTGANIWMSKWSQKSKLRPTRHIIRLSVIANTRWVKTANFNHHKSSSQCSDTWQPTDREGTMPSWTEPTLDQLIIRFNARKCSNYATPKWNNRIYLIPSLVETNTHVSTLHSMTRKQLSKIGQSIEWHFNTQTCTSSNPTQIFNPKVYQAHQLQIYRLQLWASAAVILNLIQLTRIITFEILFSYWGN